MILNLLIRAFIHLLTALILLYILIRGIKIYKNDPRKEIMIYFTLSLGLCAIGLILYAFSPFVMEGQLFFAEITLGWSFLLIIIGTLVYIHYWHTISREVPVISKMFYLTSGACLMIIYRDSDLWKLTFITGFGYYQELSTLFSGVLTLALILGVLIMYISLNTARRVFDQELLLINQEFRNEGIKGNFEKLNQQTRIRSSRKRLRGNIQDINTIIFFWVIGSILAILGILPGENAMPTDTLGLLLFFLPQAYFITKDKSLLSTLLIQNVQLRAKKLHESVSRLELKHSRDLPEENIQALVKFIEKADALLYFQENIEE